MSDQIPSLLSQAAWADSGALRRLRRLDVSHYVSVLLPSGMWLNLEARTPLGGARWVQPVLLSMGLMGTATVVIVVIVIRRLTRPLRALAGAAEGFGRGEVVEPIPETGPPEIRSATEAFNRMSNRLSRFVQDRMQILAAISHDLRTPMASLRLQAEMIEDAETRGRIMETLDEMQRMATSTLDLAREDAAREDTRMVDLGQLVEAVCNDLSDLGHDVAVDELPGVLSRCRVVALRRALRNLIENAVAYGKRARVSVHADGGEALIVIDDDGPGIPEDEQEAVFEPFVRLEPSRAKETGGVGLGLAIARSIARSHGGDITLKNRNGNGLRATLTLPLVQEQ
ncbi:MAG: ATP-binding protein [Pseudomonadota bacterium]